jgi:eukaryotic-like serine/threonine-protein kinase
MALLIDNDLFGSTLTLGLTLCLIVCLLGAGWFWMQPGGLAAAQTGAARPEWLGPYQLGEKIGEGAMGEVYRAYHAAIGVWRAVKLLPRHASERDRERFEKEARLGAVLRHPNSVSIYDRGQAPDGTCYYAMELLEGQTLQELVDREGALSPERVIRILVQLCAALDEAHGLGLVHRDIKPDNVLLSGEGPGVAKLIDFGLVEQIGEVARGQAPGTVVGTPLYLSPEAIVAPETVDARSDLYGLGALAYFLLRGAPVFHGRSVVEVCGHHLHTVPEPLSALLGETLPGELERIVLSCLAKDPAARPPSAADLRLRLEACLGGLETCQSVSHLHVLRAQRMLERLETHLAKRTTACPIAA